MAGDPAVGMIEVQGVAAAIVGADAACKAADVELAGWASIGGYTTAFFTGSISDVAAALQSGEEAARGVIEHVVAVPLHQPAAACRHFVDFPVRSDSDFPAGALGLVETRGYGAHIHTNDQMVKTAAVEVINVLTVQDRVVCSLVLGRRRGRQRSHSCRAKVARGLRALAGHGPDSAAAARGFGCIRRADGRWRCLAGQSAYWRRAAWRR